MDLEGKCAIDFDYWMKCNGYDVLDFIDSLDAMQFGMIQDFADSKDMPIEAYYEIDTDRQVYWAILDGDSIESFPTRTEARKEAVKQFVIEYNDNN